ncbi:steroid 17-alpha-hydroxylase/17,20 lyase-like isoform X1 [Amphiura filiformis]|uniref:steroid 17-alpha-hydroxylase/17,20 lyase-like isoform X1 n=1 Tax=Amphiura filiformis TaxID=82378 RepID=UPI003B217CCC
MLGALIETASSSVTAVNVALGCAAVLVYFMYNSVKRPPGMPPGPRPYPFIGNILMFRKKPARDVFRDCSKEYGNVFSVKVGKWWLVVLNDIEAVRDAFLKKPIDFADRPQLFSVELMTEGSKDISFSPYNETWKLHRKLGHSAIRHFASSRKLEKLVEEITGRMSERIDAFEGQPMDPKDVVLSGIYNLLTSLSFGETYDFDDPRLQFFINMSKEGFEIIGRGFAADFIPIARFIPESAALRKHKKHLSQYLGKIHDYFRSHRETYDPDNQRDMFDSLIHAQEEAIDEGSEHISKLTDTHLCQTISDMFGAGTESLIATLTWTIALMAENPDIQQKCVDEIHKVIGQERFPCLQDRGNLPYCEATIMEILRYSSIGQFALPHTTHCDTILRGYAIPKGTMVIPNLIAIHFDEKYWDEPETFKPEHFLDETGCIRQHPNSFLPFSTGPRVCLGEALAKSELFLLFSWLLQKYEFSKVPGQEDKPLINVDPWGFLGRAPEPYQVVCKNANEKYINLHLFVQCCR